MPFIEIKIVPFKKINDMRMSVLPKSEKGASLLSMKDTITVILGIATFSIHLIRLIVDLKKDKK